MVARDQDPGTLEGRHRLEQLPDQALADGLGIEDIAGDEDGIDAALGREPGDPADRLDPLLGNRRRIVGGELGVAATDLPVGSVEETGHLDGWGLGVQAYQSDQERALSGQTRPEGWTIRYSALIGPSAGSGRRQRPPRRGVAPLQRAPA